MLRVLLKNPSLSVCFLNQRNVTRHRNQSNSQRRFKLDMGIELALPPPWKAGTTIVLPGLSRLMWLVGPNGSGKSRFLRALRDHPHLRDMRPRFLSTDRLASVRQDEGTNRVMGDRFSNGVTVSHMTQWLEANHSDGALAGAVTLLHRRSEIRIQVEAALSQVLGRRLRLDVVDGTLRPVVRGSGSQYYGMFREECHGVLQMVVLLSNIYDSEVRMLLIDEPELNLHPQYQAFILSEIRRSGKIVVLATHSPSILAVQDLEELRQVVCFHSDFSTPTSYQGNPEIDNQVRGIVARMTHQHRSFFFADRPVFVEGPWDAIIVAKMLEAIDRSSEGAGSCVIPSIGKNEAEIFLMLCNTLGKKAVFLFDLDAIFDQRMKVGVSRIRGFEDSIAKAGHGKIDDLLGTILSKLTECDAQIVGKTSEDSPIELEVLLKYCAEKAGTSGLVRRRIAILKAIRSYPGLMQQLLGGRASELNGFVMAAIQHLQNVDIHVLANGSLENYLPSYSGSRYQIPDDAKSRVVAEECEWMSQKRSRNELVSRYGELFLIIERLPAVPKVDVKPLLQHEVAFVIQRIMSEIRRGECSSALEIRSILDLEWQRMASCLHLETITFKSKAEFSGTLVISDFFGLGQLECHFNQDTQTGNPEGLKFEKREPKV